MGKCSKCGKKIEYNNFTVINGLIYHRECAPKIEARTLNNEPVSKELQGKVDNLLEEVIGGKVELTIKKELDFSGCSPLIVDDTEKEEKKPRKKRSKKKSRKA